jgi:hypothetical protein
LGILGVRVGVVQGCDTVVPQRKDLFVAVVVLHEVLELSPGVAERGHLRVQRG